jgi:hypothetical protein
MGSAARTMAMHTAMNAAAATPAKDAIDASDAAPVARAASAHAHATATAAAPVHGGRTTARGAAARA